MEEKLVKELNEIFGLKEMDPKTYSPLALAYIGDGIYEIIIRTIIVSKGNAPVNKYHKKASQMVKAKAQADIMNIIEPLLTEEELSVYKRGRNAKSATTAKNASIIEYRMATGFEALMGYLYMKQEFSRMFQLIEMGLEKNVEVTE